MRKEVKKRLEELKGEYKLLTPHHVLEDARNEDSPLHQCFNWDVASAAQSHWLEQARDLLQAYRVEVSVHSEKRVDRFVNVKVRVDENTEMQGYVTSVEAMSDVELREQVLTQMLNEIDRLKKKYAEFEELAEIIDEKALRRVRMRARIKA